MYAGRDPRRNGEQGTVLTTYEYLVHTNRDKPWLRSVPADFSKGGAVSLGRPGARQGRSRKGGLAASARRTHHAGQSALSTREITMPMDGGQSPEPRRPSGHGRSVGDVRTMNRGPAGFKIGTKEPNRNSTKPNVASARPDSSTSSVRPPWADSNFKPPTREEMENLRASHSQTADRVRESLDGLAKHEMEVARVKAEIAFENAPELGNSEETIEEAAKKLAEEASRQVDIDSRLRWESEQHQRRLRSIQKQERALRRREKALREREEKATNSVGAESWADRVSTSYSGQQRLAKSVSSRRPATGGAVRSSRIRQSERGFLSSGSNNRKEVRRALERTSYATNAKQVNKRKLGKASQMQRSSGKDAAPEVLVPHSEPPEIDHDRDEFVSAVEWASKVRQAYVPL